MFRKYEKTFRLRGGNRKRCLTAPQVKQLLAGKVVIEEKLDGANTGIIRHKRGFHLQKRGSLVGQSEHEQFQFFHAWSHSTAWERIMSLPVGYIVYGEWLRCIHTVYYDRLPDWFISFDVWDGRKFLDRDDRDEFCEKYGFVNVPLVARGYFEVDEIPGLIPDHSAYGDFAEGVVIKKYHKKRNFMKGKWLRPEFSEKMDEKHWKTLPVRYNELEVMT